MRVTPTKALGDKNSVVALFFLWPFLALLFVLKNFRLSWAKNVVWAFIVFYGYTMVVSGDEQTGSDSVRYRNEFIELSASNITLEGFANLFYVDNTEDLDIIQPLVAFLVSRVTNNYHIFFAVLAFIFGFFYSRNIWLILDRKSLNSGSLDFLVILAFIFVVGFWNINGFRFWTATHIFLFAVLSYIIKGNRKYLLLVWFSCLVHFSFLFPSIVFMFYLLIGNKTNIYFYFFILTLSASLISSQALVNFMTNNLPSVFQKRTKLYTNEDYAETLSSKIEVTNWYIRYYLTFLKWPIIAFIVYIFYEGKKLLQRSQRLTKMFNFSLLFGALANIVSLVPSGGRFITVSYIFFLAVIFFYIQYTYTNAMVKNILWTSSPFLLLFAVVSIRFSFDSIGIATIFGNPVLATILDINIPMINLIKQ